MFICETGLGRGTIGVLGLRRCKPRLPMPSTSPRLGRDGPGALLRSWRPLTSLLDCPVSRRCPCVSTQLLVFALSSPRFDFGRWAFDTCGGCSLPERNKRLHRRLIRLRTPGLSPPPRKSCWKLRLIHSGMCPSGLGSGMS